MDMKYLKLIAAQASLIGYVDSLGAGTVITDDYIVRLHEYYFPELRAAVESYSGEQND